MATRLSVTGVSNPPAAASSSTPARHLHARLPTCAATARVHFDYDISDGNGGSDSASVTVDLTCDNDAPSADDDTVDGTEDTATDVTVRPARQ